MSFFPLSEKHVSIETHTLPSAENEISTNAREKFFIVLIIIGAVGILITLSIGLAIYGAQPGQGWWHVDNLSRFNQLDGIIFMCSSIGGIILLSIGIFGLILEKRTRNSSSSIHNLTQQLTAQSEETEIKYQTTMGAQAAAAATQEAEAETQKRNEELKMFELHIETLGSGWTIQELAEDILNPPEFLTADQIVDIIFKCQRIAPRIIALLDAVHKKYPTFTLSNYDKIRRRIVEDSLISKDLNNNNDRLTNDQFIALHKTALNNDKEKIANCYELAVRVKNPYIYHVSSTAVTNDEYTLNFLWINLNPQDRINNVAENIFKDGLDSLENDASISNLQALHALEAGETSFEGRALPNLQDIKKTFAYKIAKWADVNPNAQINIWYDSALVTQKAAKNTFEMMKTISQSRGVTINLRDVRLLPSLQTELEHHYSLHPGVPVYYRVDLLKALIADHMMSSVNEKAKYCVVTDIDVEAMPSEQIFDQRTLEYLDSYGYVFNNAGEETNFENSFSIFNKSHETVQKIHYDSVIKRAATHLTALRKEPLYASLSWREEVDSQKIYSLYGHFRDAMKEHERGAARKTVKCPPTQFTNSFFAITDHQRESFRFIGEDNIPYTKNGRATDPIELQIPTLKNWKCEPLPTITETASITAAARNQAIEELRTFFINNQLLYAGEKEQLLFKERLDKLEDIDSLIFSPNYSVLMMLAMRGKPLNFVEILQEKGANFDQQDIVLFGNTPLIWAIANANNEMAIKILDVPQNLDLRDTKTLNNTALILAIGKGYTTRSAQNQDLSVSNLKIVEKLLAKGANPNIKNSDGMSALQMAAMRRDHNMVQMLLKAGAKIDFDVDSVLNLSYDEVSWCLNHTVDVYILDKKTFESSKEAVHSLLTK